LRKINRICFHNNFYEEIISLKNLFTAWSEFKINKNKREDVASFALNAEEHIFNLAENLLRGEYYHGKYDFFKLNDPKPRNIHKASVRDRVLHHAIVRILSPVFGNTFIFDSYSSRKEKGTHKAVERFKKFAWKLSRNNTRTVWILKCDIKKYFDSINHKILLKIVNDKIKEEKLLKLLDNIINSFEKSENKGIPLGNLTSQLFSNVYLNEFDQFIKRRVRLKYYIRYADDFVIIHNDREYLERTIPNIEKFLKNCLNLELNKNKVSIQKWHKGVDFLGYIIFPYFIILRNKTRKRILRNIKIAKEKYLNKDIDFKELEAIVNSYAGVLKHCRSREIKNEINKILST